MAKKDKANKAEGKKGESAGNKLVTLFVALIILFIWLAIFAVCIKLNVGGFGSNVLRPILKDVPIINKILPAPSEDEIFDESAMTYEEAIARIRELEIQLEVESELGKDNSDKNKDLEAEVARLKVFEDNQKKFEEREREFDTNVVFNNNAPDIKEYAAYYEGINPTTAEEIYRQVTQKLIAREEVVKLAEIYSSMDAAKAAAILNTMTGDLDLIVDVLNNMAKAKSSAIIAVMDKSMAAKITKKMYPEE